MSIPTALAEIPPRANGLYRIRRPDAGDDRGLLYIGQSLVGTRLAAHAQWANTPDHPQAAVVAVFAGPLECSYVLDDTWHAHQRLELDHDLIAAHVLATGTAPPG